MKTNLFLLVSILIVSSGSCKPYNENKVDVTADTVKSQSGLANLMQDVLSLPAVIKLSKVDRVRKEYKQIYVSMSSDTLVLEDSLILQAGKPLRIIGKDKVQNNPCYMFKKIEIHGNSAHIEMKFDVTGFTCRGRLIYKDDKWVPEENFQVGYR